MLKSMTGYGKAVKEIRNKRITIEIKSLNSKQLDMSARTPGYYREKELEIRSLIGGALDRGKVDFSMYIEVLDGSSGTVINAPVILNYIKQIKALSEQNNITEPEDYFNTLLRLPDTFKTELQEIDEEEWAEILLIIGDALEQLNAFRTQEGTALEKDIFERITKIQSLLDEIPNFEQDRIEKVRTRLFESLAELKSRLEFDNNRFEQEMIFYLEKLDITEEKVRLSNHLNYFFETLKLNEPIGKKLGFITQEIGREINTIGSKANHSELQRIVIQMKDELEKVKEQTLNIL